ncbi:cyclic nucleotide-binding domain-containing protein [Flagellimonas sp. DF-77]|uniref:Crp/Fnr family transcriptional regulator n=1 Tax=Flagellimonas algarum TaxID=3230298 RepID=UPI003396BFD1
MVASFIQKIEHYVKPSLGLQTELAEVCKPIEVRKNEILVRHGGVYWKAFFIVEGSFKSSLLTPEGHLKTTWFYFDRLFSIIPIRDSFLSGKPTKFEIQALEDSVVLEIDMNAVNSWLQKYPEFNEFFRVDMINDFIMGEEIRTHLLCYSKQDFLKYLFDTFPIIIARTPSHALADFMGITPEWCSKLKKKLAILKS